MDEIIKIKNLKMINSSEVNILPETPGDLTKIFTRDQRQANKQHIKKIWEVVKEIEESKGIELQEYGEAKATMIVNYGDNGWNTRGLISHTDSLPTMILKVLNYYDDKLKSKTG